MRRAIGIGVAQLGDRLVGRLADPLPARKILRRLRNCLEESRSVGTHTVALVVEAIEDAVAVLGPGPLRVIGDEAGRKDVDLRVIRVSSVPHAGLPPSGQPLLPALGTCEADPEAARSPDIEAA